MRLIHTADIHLDSPLKGLEVHEDAPVNEMFVSVVSVLPVFYYNQWEGDLCPS